MTANIRTIDKLRKLLAVSNKNEILVEREDLKRVVEELAAHLKYGAGFKATVRDENGKIIGLQG